MHCEHHHHSLQKKPPFNLETTECQKLQFVLAFFSWANLMPLVPLALFYVKNEKTFKK